MVADPDDVVAGDRVRGDQRPILVRIVLDVLQIDQADHRVVEHDRVPEAADSGCWRTVYPRAADDGPGVVDSPSPGHAALQGSDVLEVGTVAVAEAADLALIGERPGDLIAGVDVGCVCALERNGSVHSDGPVSPATEVLKSPGHAVAERVRFIGQRDRAGDHSGVVESRPEAWWRDRKGSHRRGTGAHVRAVLPVGVAGSAHDLAAGVDVLREDLRAAG